MCSVAVPGGALGAPALWPAQCRLQCDVGGSISCSSKRKLGPACLQSWSSASGLLVDCPHLLYPVLSLKPGSACLQEVCLHPLVAMPIPQTERVAAVRHLPAASALQLLQYLAKLVQLHAGKYNWFCFGNSRFYVWVDGDASTTCCSLDDGRPMCAGLLLPLLHSCILPSSIAMLPAATFGAPCDATFAAAQCGVLCSAVASSLYNSLVCDVASSQLLQHDSLFVETCLCCCRELPVDRQVWAAASAEPRTLTSDARTQEGHCLGSSHPGRPSDGTGAAAPCPAGGHSLFLYLAPCGPYAGAAACSRCGPRQLAAMFIPLYSGLGWNLRAPHASNAGALGRPALL